MGERSFGEKWQEAGRQEAGHRLALEAARG